MLPTVVHFFPGFKYQIRAIQEVTADTVKSQKGKEDDEQNSPQNWKIKMLYDGDCPLCMREVHHFSYIWLMIIFGVHYCRGEVGVSTLKQRSYCL